MPQNPPVTVAEAVGKWALLVTGCIASLVLYILLMDKPFGWQITVAVGFTTAVFFFVFFRWRGMPESFSLRDKKIQRQLPRLVALHAAFLMFLLVGLIEWHGFRSRLPDYWVTEQGPRHDSPYSAVLVLFSLLIFYAEVFLARRILKRALNVGKRAALNG